MKREKLAAVFFAVAMVLAMAGSAGAVDGTIEINQAKVLANGGFPYTISASGSYRLTGNLTVSGSTDGIDVNASNVTIDLNGFSIIGPVNGFRRGVSAQQYEVTVENGTVTGFGVGLLLSNNSVVKSVHADANAVEGISVGSNSVIDGCTANSNQNDSGIQCSGGGCTISGNTTNSNSQGYGILSDASSVIEGNTANFNGVGIGCFNGAGCLILRNNISSNTSVGIQAADLTTSYGENVINGNPTAVQGGTSLGAGNTNLCNGTRC